MNYRKEFIKRFILGAPFGVLLTDLMIVFIAMFNETLNLNSGLYVTNFFVSLILGGYLCGVSVIYSVEEWGLLKQTTIHLIAVTPFFPVAWFMGWLPSDGIMIVVYLLCWLGIYGIIWVMIKTYYARTVNELNAGLMVYQKRGRS